MSWKRIGQSNTYEAHLAHKSLRRHAAGKKQALLRLEETMMWANAAIAREGKQS